MQQLGHGALVGLLRAIRVHFPWVQYAQFLGFLVQINVIYKEVPNTVNDHVTRTSPVIPQIQILR